MKSILILFYRLKDKWEITSNFQFFLIMLVFAVTGSLSLVIADLLMPLDLIYFKFRIFHLY